MTADLRPTPARLALLQAVADDYVVYEMLGARYYDYSTETTVTGTIHELMDAGWVVRFAAEDPELTAAGRAVLAAATRKD